MKRLVTFALAAAIFASTSAIAQAHHRHHYRYNYHHSTSYRGACDGFHRCRCGTTAARLHGLPYSYRGYNLKLAWEWQRAFRHTSFHVGAVGVKPHHVLTIVGGSSCGSATVHDDAGIYRRNVCGMIFVDANGNSIQRRSTTTYHARSHYRYVNYRSEPARRSFQPI